QRDPNRFPLVQILFNYHQRSDSKSIQPRRELTASFENTDLLKAGTGEFDLVLTLTDSPAGLEGDFSYDGNAFDQQTIQGMAAEFQALLEAVAAEPDQPLWQLIG